MSTRAVCGGAFPGEAERSLRAEENFELAARDKCLFTVVDEDDNPKMVIEFSPDFSDFIEVEQLERQKWLPPLLESCGIQYVTMNSQELGEIVDPSGSLDFVSFLSCKFGLEDPYEEQDEELYPGE